MDLAQPTTTGDGSIAGTTGGTTVDGVGTTLDSNGALDMALLGGPQALAQPADFLAALSTTTKKDSSTSGSITSNLK
jgi:hypothetical protein